MPRGRGAECLETEPETWQHEGHKVFQDQKIWLDICFYEIENRVGY